MSGGPPGNCGFTPSLELARIARPDLDLMTETDEAGREHATHVTGTEDSRADFLHNSSLMEVGVLFAICEFPL